MTETKRRQRGNARADRRAKRERSTRASVPFITRRVPTFELASEEVLALIENNADTVLETIGIDFRDDPLALDLLKQAGASVEGERVRFPKGMCREI
ncbi:MAG: trimethylamine methyltransferase, partial [Proteobacteria bacterium]|nr:trimethylamine methyltransferase [Pseudomonadota bacterium]